MSYTKLTNNVQSSLFIIFISFGKLLMRISSSMLLLIKLSRNIMLIYSYVVRKTASYIPIYPSFLAACMTMLKAVKQFHTSRDFLHFTPTCLFSSILNSICRLLFKPLRLPPSPFGGSSFSPWGKFLPRLGEPLINSSKIGTFIRG